MLKKRIIFTLLYSENFFHLSRNFRLQKIGNYKWLKDNYNFSKISFFIDELIILNIQRDNKNFQSFFENIKHITKECFIPVTIGGGINNLQTADIFFRNGADKILVNSVIHSNIDLIKKLASIYGSQSIVASIDLKKNNDKFEVFISNGTIKISMDASDYIKKICDLPIGEIMINSIDRDGTGQGYMIELLKIIPKEIKIPLIISGGAGNFNHLLEGVQNNSIDAVATANLLNFVGDGLISARNKIISHGYSLAKWKNIKDCNFK